MWVYDCKKDAVSHVRWAAELCLLCEIHSNPSALQDDQGLHPAELPRGVSHRCHHVSHVTRPQERVRVHPLTHIFTHLTIHLNMTAHRRYKNPTGLTPSVSHVKKSVT